MSEDGLIPGLVQKFTSKLIIFVKLCISHLFYYRTVMKWGEKISGNRNSIKIKIKLRIRSKIKKYSESMKTLQSHKILNIDNKEPNFYL